MSGDEKAAKARQRRSLAEKQQIVEETLVAGASVAAVARAHAINANQIFAWRRLYQSGQLVGRRSRASRHSPARLLPVAVMEEPLAPAVATIPSGAASGVIHIQFPQAQLRVEGVVDATTLRVVLEYLRG
jgi:transposase